MELKQKDLIEKERKNTSPNHKLNILKGSAMFNFTSDKQRHNFQQIFQHPNSILTATPSTINSLLNMQRNIKQRHNMKVHLRNSEVHLHNDIIHAPNCSTRSLW